MLKLFAVLLLVAAVSGGKLPEWQGRIHGGSGTQPSEIKYHLSIRDRWNGHYCMGALLSSKWGLTTGNCVTGKELMDINMVTGATSVRDGTPHATGRVVIHPQFSAGIFDAALLEAKDYINILPWVVNPVGLESMWVEAGVKVKVVGWGMTQGVSDTLRQATWETLSNEDCGKALNHGGDLHKSLMCTVGSTDYGVCYQDRGAPLVKAWEGGLLVGISSFPKCDSNLPEEFTRVDFIREWIGEVTGL